ncbi:MAG TPA: helix-turn-helix domain-containing protein, partial [Clostridia bacterium]|nr:helix-turn-helix domain-containing protein [Clostridia bacterium]
MPSRIFVYQAIIRSLNSIEVSHPTLRAVWLHLNRSHSILVSGAKYPYDFFVSRLPMRERGLFEGTVGQEISFRLLVNQEASGDGSAFLYAASLPLSADRPGFTAYASIRPEVISGMLDPLVQDEALALFADAQGKPLLYRQNGMDASEAEYVLQAIAEDMDRTGWLTIRGKRYFLMKTEVRPSNTYLFAVLPARRIQKAATGIARTTVWTLLAASAMLFVLAYYGSRSQYKPIRTLMNSAVRFAEEPACPDQQNGPLFRDEFGFIGSTLQATFENNENLRQLVTQAHSRIAAQLLDSLLNGHPVDEEALRQELGLTGGIYQVLLFEKDTGGSGTSLDLTGVGRFDRLRWHAAWLGQDLAVITEMDEGHERPDIVYSLVESLRAACARQNYPVTVGIGGAFRHIAGISTSYVQARAAAQYAHVRGQHTVIHIDEVPQDQTCTFSYPAVDELRIINAIKAGDGDTAWASILELIQSNMENRAPLPAVVATLYCAIMNTFTRTAGEGHLPYVPEQKPVPSTPQAFAARMPEMEGLCRELAENAQQKLKNANQRLFDQVIGFVEENYAQELSLDKLSEHTGYSVSYISYVFKQVSGDNYVDYVNRFRIGKAKELLSATELPIADIAIRTGFIS